MQKPHYQFLSLPFEVSLLIEMLEWSWCQVAPMEVIFDLDLKKSKMQWVWIDCSGNNIDSRNLDKCLSGRSKEATQFSLNSNICSLNTIILWLFEIMNQCLIHMQIKFKYLWLPKFLRQLHFDVWSRVGIGIFISIDETRLLIFNPQIENDFTSHTYWCLQ